MNSCNLQIREKWQRFLWMVLAPTHTANAGIQFLSSPAQGMRELSTRQAFSFLATPSGPHTREGNQLPLESFSANTIQSVSLVCKLSPDFQISLCFRQAGPSAVLPKLWGKRETGGKTINKRKKNVKEQMGLQLPELQLKFCESPLWFSGNLWPHPPYRTASSGSLA